MQMLNITPASSSFSGLPTVCSPLSLEQPYSFLFLDKYLFPQVLLGQTRTWSLALYPRHLDPASHLLFLNSRSTGLMNEESFFFLFYEYYGLWEELAYSNYRKKPSTSKKMGKCWWQPTQNVMCSFSWYSQPCINPPCLPIRCTSQTNFQWLWNEIRRQVLERWWLQSCSPALGLSHPGLVETSQHVSWAQEPRNGDAQTDVPGFSLSPQGCSWEQPLTYTGLPLDKATALAPTPSAAW